MHVLLQLPNIHVCMSNNIVIHMYTQRGRFLRICGKCGCYCTVYIVVLENGYTTMVLYSTSTQGTVWLCVALHMPTLDFQVDEK